MWHVFLIPYSQLYMAVYKITSGSNALASIFKAPAHLCWSTYGTYESFMEHNQGSLSEIMKVKDHIRITPLFV